MPTSSAAHARQRTAKPLAGPTLVVVLVAAAVGSSAIAAPPARAAEEFPAGHAGYHTYAEMVAEVSAIANAHPAIVRRFSIGRSYQGRHLWAAKVSDNVGVDEPEPEVMFDGLHHADEHMGLEMTIRILRWLTNGYRRDDRITTLVDNREVWIVFAVNPDGGEFDIKGGRFHYWRKNRQPNDGSPYVGTDLNRNYGYRWGGGGRTSSNPQAITYRGSHAFSTPEARAMRAFLASRVVDGRQQIRASITFHETGRLVMWPYGYTYRNVPPDMTSADHRALVAIGRRMAASNGYTPEQASDLYITSGTSRDYAYGRYRIFAYTFELSNRDYMDDALIHSETHRNREAILYLIGRAWCPLGALGARVAELRCGPLDDDFEVARGWRVDPGGTDTATGGRWTRGNPSATAAFGPKQLGHTPSGVGALVTGLAAGRGARGYDIDGGRTSVSSPEIGLAGSGGQELRFRYYLAHGPDATVADELRVEVVGQLGGRTTVFLERAAANDDDASWGSAAIRLDAWAGQTIRIVFSATDAGRESLVEAAIDDVRVTHR